MDKIGIIVAMDVELSFLLEALESPVKAVISGMDFYEGEIRGNSVVIARSGIGKVCAAICAQTMIREFIPGCIIVGGIAGAIQNLPYGSVVVGDKLVQHDFILNAFGYEDGYLPALKKTYLESDHGLAEALIQAAMSLDVFVFRGVIASGDCFVNTQSKKEYILNTYHAAACEMEGAAIAQVCEMNRLPYCVIRCISDSGDEQANEDIESNEMMASSGSAAVILQYLEGLKND